MAEENLIDKLKKGEIVECKVCNNGYYVPFNTSSDKAHSFYCSNSKCNSIIQIDPVIDIE